MSTYDDLTAAAAALEAERVAAVQRADDAERALADHMASHEPPKPTTPAPLIGMSAPARLWDERKAAVEAGGGRLQARRIFVGSLTGSLNLVVEAVKEGLLPVVSFKVDNDWAGVAAGRYDTQLKQLADKLRVLLRPVVVILHHEPDRQSDGRLDGEGGSAVQFAAMYRHAIPILKAASNVQVWVCMNGWVFDDTRASLTDAELDVWLPADVRQALDGIAADDYSPAGGRSPGVEKTRRRTEWAKRVGDVKALGVGETNAYTEAELRDVFAHVATEPLYRGGWALVWNSTGEDYKPLEETGLLPTFQEILADW